MLINNNQTLFHLWRKENLVKYLKISRYYEHGYSSLPCFKRILENGNPTAHVVYAKYFETCWFQMAQQQSFLLGVYFI